MSAQGSEFDVVGRAELGDEGVAHEAAQLADADMVAYTDVALSREQHGPKEDQYLGLAGRRRPTSCSDVLR